MMLNIGKQAKDCGGLLTSIIPDSTQLVLLLLLGQVKGRWMERSLVGFRRIENISEIVTNSQGIFFTLGEIAWLILGAFMVKRALNPN